MLAWVLRNMILVLPSAATSEVTLRRGVRSKAWALDFGLSPCGDVVVTRVSRAGSDDPGLAGVTTGDRLVGGTTLGGAARRAARPELPWLRGKRLLLALRAATHVVVQVRRGTGE